MTITARPDVASTPSANASTTRLPRRPGVTTDLDMLLEEVTPGHAVFSTLVSANEGLDTRSARLFTTLLDLSLAAAVQSTLAPGVTYRAIELRVRHVQGGLPVNNSVRCVGDVVTSGRRFTTASGRVVDAAGRVRAYGWLVVRVNANPPVRR